MEPLLASRDRCSEALIRVVADDRDIELIDGSSRRYVNLDNAATTPPAREVYEAVSDLMSAYGSVQRGAGLKSIASTAIYDGAIRALRDFVSAHEDDVVVVAGNTTTAINRLAMNFGFEAGDVVLLSEVEHSSNELPWRALATVVHVHCEPSGALDLSDLEERLRQFGRRVKLVAVTGASNASGYVPPIREVARLAHRYGAEVFVDCAQLVAHRRVYLRTSHADEDPDYVAFSGHKMYAPYGAGVLVGRARPFLRNVTLDRPPDLPGGGTIEMLTQDRIIWANIPNKLGPGTPNVVGVVAMAIAAKLLSSLDVEQVRQHERVLVETAQERFAALDGVRLHGQTIFRNGDEWLPIFPFTVRGCHHSLVAAVLGHEYGIAVRSGHLCQYQFMRRELTISDVEQARQESLLARGDKSEMYGMVRASCALCSSVDDLQRLSDALEEFIRQGPRFQYEQDRSSGQFVPLRTKRTWVSLVPNSLRTLVDNGIRGDI